MQIKLENKMASDEIVPPAELPANKRRGGSVLPEQCKSPSFAPTPVLLPENHHNPAFLTFYQISLNDAIQLLSQCPVSPPILIKHVILTVH